jgi:hypothetical protein
MSSGQQGGVTLGSDGRERIARWIAFPVVLVARLLAVVVALVFWFALLPVWLLLMLWVVVRLSGRITFSVFRGGGTMAAKEQIEHMALLWPLGLVVIVSMLFGKFELGALAPQQPLELLLETLLAMVLVTWMMFSFELVTEIVPVLGKARAVVWPYMTAGWDTVLEWVRNAAIKLLRL